MPPEWTPPTEFEEYRLVRRLGHGAMGQVWLATDTMLERPVAIKFIAELDPDDQTRERFFVEARAIARLTHPNVVGIYRIGDLDRRPFIVSELVRGKCLADLEGPLPPPQVIQIGGGLARGLAAAHRRGVLHRDIKPANAMLTDDGTVKLLDFGLAKLAELHASVSRDAPAPSAEELALTQSQTASLPTDATEAPVGGGSGGPRTPVLATPTTAKRDRVFDRGSSAPITRAGAFVGTPLYIAPEIWRGEPATGQSDIYALGMVLYELASGHPPPRGATIGEVRRRAIDEDLPPLAASAPQIDPRLATIIHRCTERDRAKRFATADALVDAIDELSSAGRRDVLPEGNPYRGLLSFDEAHRALFFGRGAEVRALVERLRAEPLVLVAGESGVGKSSLCAAGVLPAFVEGAAAPWTVVRLVPGRRPLVALAAGVATVLGEDEASIGGRLAQDPGSLARGLRGRRDGRTVLFVDQLEELVTLSDGAEADVVARALGLLAVPSQNVRLLASVRSDFLARVAALPGLGDEVARSLYLLRPLGEDGLREAIVGPARANGFRFESDALVATLVTSAEGQLPLLQFALAALWESRDVGARTIGAAALERLGGVGGALARHADGVLEELLPGPRASARRILVRLVTAERTRARRSVEDLCGDDPADRAALDALVRGRLLVARGGDAPSFELAHEALIEGWPTLARWLGENAEAIAVRERLAVAVAEWARGGRPADSLWSPRQLAETAVLAGEKLGERERDFLDRSRRAARRARWRRGAIAVAVPLLVATVYGGLRIQAGRELSRKVDVHVAEAQLALGEARIRAADAADWRRQALALFDANDRDAGEQKWEPALALDADADVLLGRAGQELETSLLLDNRRRDLRARLAEVLYERVLIAERHHRENERVELLRRLALYDSDGSFGSRLAAPATLTLDITPADATVSAGRYAIEGGRYRLAPVPDPVRPGTVSLAPGSYLFTVAARGRAPVRYPVLLERGETVRAAIKLPPSAAIPPGFAYIPEGRFRWGSADETLRKTFLNSVPLHSLSTGAYLIAFQETTFAQWIEYLEALPHEERMARRPRGQVFDDMRLDLQEAGGTWRLSFSPSGASYVAVAGQRIHYRARTERAVQDWLRFPVSGISCEDAAAYTGWLRATARVPGARLCSEIEWERAARGADERQYPHGDSLEPHDANFDRTYGQKPIAFGPDVVGSHELSRSPFGIDDLLGNAFEWTRSIRGGGTCTIRGGAYYYNAVTCNSTNREEPVATFRDSTMGLRVCADPPSF